MMGVFIHYCAAVAIGFGQQGADATQRRMEPTPVCDQALIANAQTSFRQRKGKDSGQALARAESDIKQALQACSTAVAVAHLQKRLRIVEEEIAQHNLYLALFYLRADGIGLSQGAMARLKAVYEKYPKFSKRDQVLYMLGELTAENGAQSEALDYYRAVIDEFPRSKYATLARQKLRGI